MTRNHTKPLMWSLGAGGDHWDTGQSQPPKLSLGFTEYEGVRKSNEW